MLDLFEGERRKKGLGWYSKRSEVTLVSQSKESPQMIMQNLEGYYFSSRFSSFHEPLSIFLLVSPCLNNKNLLPVPNPSEPGLTRARANCLPDVSYISLL